MDDTPLLRDVKMFGEEVIEERGVILISGSLENSNGPNVHNGGGSIVCAPPDIRIRLQADRNQLLKVVNLKKE